MIPPILPCFPIPPVSRFWAALYFRAPLGFSCFHLYDDFMYHL
jgi:hypothetical protein